MTDRIEEARQRRMEVLAGRKEERQVPLTRFERDMVAEIAAKMYTESRRVYAEILTRIADRWDGPDVLRTAYQWASREGIQIRDDDGWRADSPLGQKLMTEPITQAEYEERRNISTIGPASS